MNNEGKSDLTNLKCIKTFGGGYRCDFTISELEVWEIIFEK